MVGKVRSFELTIRPGFLRNPNKDDGTSIMTICVIVDGRMFQETKAVMDDDVTPRLEYMFEEAKRNLFDAIRDGRVG